LLTYSALARSSDYQGDSGGVLDCNANGFVEGDLVITGAVGATKSDIASDQRFRPATAVGDWSKVNMFYCQLMRLEHVRKC
jgi:hypothetical protein